MTDYSRFWMSMTPSKGTTASMPRSRTTRHQDQRVAQDATPDRDLSPGWHDSSFELRRGLVVVDTGLDPAAFGPLWRAGASKLST